MGQKRPSIFLQKKKGLLAGDRTLAPQIELSMVKMEGFSSPFCLSDKALVGVLELVQPMGVILTVDCLAINFLFFISRSLLSLSCPRAMELVSGL